jgi:hypothetical protein
LHYIHFLDSLSAAANLAKTVAAKTSISSVATSPPPAHLREIRIIREPVWTQILVIAKIQTKFFCLRSFIADISVWWLKEGNCHILPHTGTGCWHRQYRGKYLQVSSVVVSIMKPMWCTFHSTYWESRASTCFEHYLLILRRCWTNGTWYIACVLCQLAVSRLQFHCNRATALQLTYTRNIPSVMCAAPPEDEQVMLETCRGPWFSINLMKSVSCWFYYADILCMMYGQQNINTLRTGDANLRFLHFCITTVKDGWRKIAF